MSAGSRSTRMFLRPRSSSSASSSKAGATMTSVNTPLVCSTISAVTVWFVAMMPP